MLDPPLPVAGVQTKLAFRRGAIVAESTDPDIDDVGDGSKQSSPDCSRYNRK
jgi:hypothetical protein